MDGAARLARAHPDRERDSAARRVSTAVDGGWSSVGLRARDPEVRAGGTAASVQERLCDDEGGDEGVGELRQPDMRSSRTGEVWTPTSAVWPVGEPNSRRITTVSTAGRS